MSNRPSVGKIAEVCFKLTPMAIFHSCRKMNHLFKTLIRSKSLMDVENILLFAQFLSVTLYYWIYISFTSGEKYILIYLQTLFPLVKSCLKLSSEYLILLMICRCFPSWIVTARFRYTFNERCKEIEFLFFFLHMYINTQPKRLKTTSASTKPLHEKGVPLVNFTIMYLPEV